MYYVTVLLLLRVRCNRRPYSFVLFSSRYMPLYCDIKNALKKHNVDQNTAISVNNLYVSIRLGFEV